MVNFWKRKDQAAKKWRYKAWLVDPKETKITIINEKLNTYVLEENSDLEELNLEELVSCLFFPIKKSARAVESCNQGAGALLDMEQT